MDIFEPGSGSQVHDFNGGILASGLFWTLPIDDDQLRLSRNGRRATLRVRGLPVLDSFQFFGPNQTPASIDMHVRWETTEPAKDVGSGASVPETDPAAFTGELSVARSIGRFAGSEFGFAFRAEGDTVGGGFAEMGYSRNGVFL